MTVWNWLNEFVPGSLFVMAVGGSWTQLVTHRRHRERLAQNERIALALRRPD